MIGFIVASLLVVQVPEVGAGAGTWQHLTRADGLPGDEVRAVLSASDGTVWFAVREHGLAALSEDGSWQYVTDEDGLASNGVAELAEVGGSIWAVGQAGYSVFDGVSWQAVNTIGDRRARVVFSVTESSAGALWLGASGFAARFEEGDWAIYGAADGLPHAVVHEVWSDRAGVTWFACRRGLGRLEGGELSVLFPDLNFRSVVEDGAGKLWFGTGGGGVRAYSGSQWEHHLGDQTALPKLVDSSGGIWASSEGDGVYRYDGGEWIHYTTEDGLPSNVVFDIAAGENGAIWFATDSGASRLSPP